MTLSEEMLSMNTLNRKYFRMNTMMEKIVPLIKDGFSDKEIGELTGAQKKYIYQLRWNLANPERHLQHVKQRAERNLKEREIAMKRRKRQQAKERASAAPKMTQMDMFSPIIEQMKPTIAALAKALDEDKVKTLDNTVKVINSGTLADMVNNPPHYTVGGISVFDFIEAKQLPYGRGNVIKYVTRAGVKDAATELQDLEKAQWYLTAEIERLKGKK
jgi:hypothetical protein